MKGFMALALVMLLGLSAYNYWEIHTLRQEIAALNEKVRVQADGGTTTQMIAKAAATFIQARDALNKMDTSQVRTAYESARQRLEGAVKVANEKAGPAGRWLRDEASNLGRQLQADTRGR